MEKGLGKIVKTKKINRDTKSWSSGGGRGKKKKRPKGQNGSLLSLKWRRG